MAMPVQFLIKFVVEELVCHTFCKDGNMKAKFLDFFNIDLKEPLKLNILDAKQKTERYITKQRLSSDKHAWQSVVIKSQIETLIANMKNHEMELSLWDKEGPFEMGNSHFFWNPLFIRYLLRLRHNDNLPPVFITEELNIVNEVTSQCVAVVKLNIKLTCLTRNFLKKLIAIENEHTDSINIPDLNTNSDKNGEQAILQQYYETNNRHFTNIVNDKDEINTKCCNSLKQRKFNFNDFIFGDNSNLPSQTFCVNYFTVATDSSKQSSHVSESSNTCETSTSKTCGNCGEVEKSSNKTCKKKTVSIETPETCKFGETCQIYTCENKLEHIGPCVTPDPLEITKCDDNTCNKKKDKVTLPTCDKQSDVPPCYCVCDCKMDFIKTTYCDICGGYQTVGEDLNQVSVPMPCPLYHNLMDKVKSKRSTSTVDSKSQKSRKSPGKDQLSDTLNSKTASDKPYMNKQLFKYYDYIAPKRGHYHCVSPCTGLVRPVPRNMGWLWHSNDILQLKFRPFWAPGAISKPVLRLLQIAKDPGIVIKKKKQPVDTKRAAKRPLLVVHKIHGEFTVTMERMKRYERPRPINKTPYEDKPPLTYTIGRTEEENRDIKRRKERKLERLRKDQCRFIQNTFINVCKEICPKTYEQALGILPGDPNCSCFLYSPDDPTLESCPCSDESSSKASDTDSDEWILKFTPPVATHYPNRKVDNVKKFNCTTQYSYLDYRVKLFDYRGIPVPRFFKGPDGTTQCSDLGGFRSPNHDWLTINVDGIVGPDGRWAPMMFTGPAGDTVDITGTGEFSIKDKKYVVGVDGYVDKNGKWKAYTGKKSAKYLQSKQKMPIKKTTKDIDDKKHDNSDGAWSCFGTASPQELSKIGIVGHGSDRKLLLAKLKEMLAQGEDVKIPQPSVVPRLSEEQRIKCKERALIERQIFEERNKCHHSMPSDKGIRAVDDLGNKVYFRLSSYRNRRPNERKADLKNRGITLSSFHEPCLDSMCGTELMEKQLKERLARYSAREAIASVY